MHYLEVNLKQLVAGVCFQIAIHNEVQSQTAGTRHWFCGNWVVVAVHNHQLFFQCETEEHHKIPDRAGTEQVRSIYYVSTSLYFSVSTGRYWGKSLEPQSPEEKEEEKAGFANNGFNQFRSDRIPLDREVPDTRDPR